MSLQSKLTVKRGGESGGHKNRLAFHGVHIQIFRELRPMSEIQKFMNRQRAERRPDTVKLIQKLVANCLAYLTNNESHTTYAPPRHISGQKRTEHKILH